MYELNNLVEILTTQYNKHLQMYLYKGLCSKLSTNLILINSYATLFFYNIELYKI